MEELLRQVDPEGLPQGPDGSESPTKGDLVENGFEEGYGDSGDNERAGSVSCPACGHLFSPGR